MFEDFKDKIRQHNSKDEKNLETTTFSPEVLDKLKQRGIDPENFKQSIGQ